jgi:hypothetical protein
MLFVRVYPRAACCQSDAFVILQAKEPSRTVTSELRVVWEEEFSCKEPPSLGRDVLALG